MNKHLSHAFGVAAALLGFFFFRLWPSSPPLSVTQDDYLQRVAAAPPAPTTPPVAVAVPMPAPVAVHQRPAEPPAPSPALPPSPVMAVTPPELLASMRPPRPVVALAASSPTVDPETAAVPVPPRARARRPSAVSPTPQGVNARVPRHDVQPGRKTGGVNDLYGPQSSALDDFAKKSEKGG